LQTVCCKGATPNGLNLIHPITHVWSVH
jgi:hypothetical protein